MGFAEKMNELKVYDDDITPMKKFAGTQNRHYS